MLTTEAKGDGEFKPYLRSKNIQWITPDIRDVREMWIANSEKQQLRVKKGDLLISEGGEVGRACLWTEELPECYIQNSVHRITVKHEMLSEFLLLQFFVYGKRGRFESIVNRVSIGHLTREKLINVVFAVPSVEEQRVILDRLQAETRPLDEVIGRTQREIDLVREYRDRLIADVVTGQVDVRGWVPDPDDGVADDELAVLAGDEEPNTEGDDEDGGN
jgi:type I restriction enzyme S subunit